MLQSEQATALALRVTQNSIDRSRNADHFSLLRKIDRYLDGHPGAGMRLDLRLAIKRAAKGV